MTSHRLKLKEGHAMPPHEPAYPEPGIYRDERLQFVYFRADPERVWDLVPEPFEPTSDGMCVAFTIHQPFGTSYGPTYESGVAEKVTVLGQTGFYISHLFLDNMNAIMAGRERWGAPKLYGRISLDYESNVLIGRTTREGLDVMTVTTKTHTACTDDDLPAPFMPWYFLKIIPRADGPGAAIKQVVSFVTPVPKVHVYLKGSGAVIFNDAAGTLLGGLRPIDTLGGFYLVYDEDEAYGTVLMDCLEKGG